MRLSSDRLRTFQILFLLGMCELLAPCGYGDDPQQDSAPATDSPQQAADVPRIELVGVCASPLDEHGWWDINGERLSTAPALKAAKPAEEVANDLEPDEISRLIVLRAVVPSGASIETQIDGQKWTWRWPESADGQSWDELKKEVEARGEPFEADAFQTIEYSLGVHLRRQRTDRAATAEVRVAEGDWTTVAERPKQPGDGNQLSFDLGKIGKEGIETFDSATYQKSVRVLAKDKNGKLHHSRFHMVMKGSEGTVLNIRVSFAVPVADIVAYHLQTRPYERFELSAIPLYANDLPAVERIRILGGHFGGDREVLGDRRPAEKPTDLDWVNVTDDEVELIQNVPSLRRVSIAGAQITDRTAQLLAQIPQLQHVRISGPRLTDRSLASFADSHVHTLEVLGPGLTSVGNDSIEALANAQNLASLRLWDTDLTDANAAQLAKARGLRRITARGDQLTDDGIEKLASLPQLTELQLGITQCTDAAFNALAAQKELKILDVRSREVSDAAMPAIGNLTSLVDLNLAGTNVSNAGLQQLAPLEHLERLDLQGTKCDRQGWEKLIDGLGHWFRVQLPEPPSRDLTVEVELVDAAGEAVPKAKVYLFTSETDSSPVNRIGNPGEQPKQIGMKVTDSSGRCRINTTTADTQRYLLAWAVGPAGAVTVDSWGVARSGGAVTRRLVFTDSKLELRLIDSQGRPISNVDAFPTRIRPGRVVELELPEAILESPLRKTSDDEGRITFTGLEPSQVMRLGFRNTQRGNQSTQWLRNKLTDEINTVQLAETGSLRGRINFPANLEPEKIEGIFYVSCRLDRREEATVFVDHVWAPLEANPQGVFDVPALADGYVSYLDLTRGNLPRLIWESVEIEPGRETNASPDAIRPIKIEGWLRLQKTWRSVPEFPVSLSSGGKNGRWSTHRNVKTDAAGRFIDYVIPGELNTYVSRFYRSTFRYIGHWLWRGGKFGGYREVASSPKYRFLEPIDLVRSLEKTGRLIDEEGNPVPNESVYGFPAPLSAKVTASSGGVRTRKDGSFTLTFPETYPPVAFRGNDRDVEFEVKQRDPLVLIKPDESEE